MIVTKVYGGLGNQMFQYALGRHLSLNYNKELFLDLSWFDTNKGDTVRNFELSGFCTKYQVLGNLPVKDAIVLQEHSLDYNNFGDVNKIMTSDRDIVLNGYWQREKYFASSLATLKREFQPKISMISDKCKEYFDILKKSRKCVGLHVRRGDYVNNKYHGTIDISYYYNCINKILENTSIDTLFIFSDDASWCHQNFTSIACSQIVISGISSYESIDLMSYCDYIIIANSSFSWWAAELKKDNKHENVFAPKNWFLEPGAQKQISTIYKSDWKLMDNLLI